MFKNKKFDKITFETEETKQIAVVHYFDIIVLYFNLSVATK